MDRVEFLQSIRVENRDILIKYFDQFMGLYGLVPDIDFTTEVHTPENITQGIIVKFILGKENYELVQKIGRDLQSGMISMYNHSYVVQMISGSPSGFAVLVGL